MKLSSDQSNCGSTETNYNVYHEPNNNNNNNDNDNFNDNNNNNNNNNKSPKHWNLISLVFTCLCNNNKNK